MSQTLRNRRALVTGGSRGIGAAIVKRLAREGADVAFTYVSNANHAQETAAAAKAIGVKSIAIQADSADAAAVVAAVEKTVSELGGIDIFVNNAGIAVMGPLEDFRLEEFDRTFAVNVRAAFVAIQAVAKHMKAGGRIATIGSCLGERVPFPGVSVYAMSKAAIAGLVRGLARDLGPKGININNVQPGPIDTDLNPEHGEFAETLKKSMALPRYAKADEVAALVAYLVGPESGFVTGASVTIDGGLNA